jgi:predicted acylesterase/phospholipase RssA
VSCQRHSWQRSSPTSRATRRPLRPDRRHLDRRHHRARAWGRPDRSTDPRLLPRARPPHLSRQPLDAEGTRPRHSEVRREQLQAELESVLGDRRIGESKTRLVIPSMDVTSGKVHLWKTAHNARFLQDYQLRMVDAAMATSAARTFFKPALTDAGTPLVDGGVFANNPAGLAAVEAISHGRARRSRS